MSLPQKFYCVEVAINAMSQFNMTCSAYDYLLQGSVLYCPQLGIGCTGVTHHVPLVCSSAAGLCAVLPPL